MPLYLQVPYEEREQAKKLGGIWDNGRKQWYVLNKNNYQKFLRWYPYLDGYDDILCDWVYIVRTKYKCPKCNKNTSVIAFAIQNHFEVEVTKSGKIKKWDYHDEFIRLIQREYEVLFGSDEEQRNHNRFENYLRNRFGYYYESSNCYANHCWECGAVLEFSLLHEIPGGPFYLDTLYCKGVPQPKDFKLFKIFLSEDGLFTQYYTGDGIYTYDQFILDENKKIEILDFKISIMDL
jgi:hypothetical protein